MNESPKPVETQVADYLMEHGFLKNADAIRCAGELIQIIAPKLEAMTALKNSLQDALETIERTVGFAPKDEPLSAWVERVVKERNDAWKALQNIKRYSKTPSEFYGFGYGGRLDHVDAIASKALELAKAIGIE